MTTVTKEKQNRMESYLTIVHNSNKNTARVYEYYLKKLRNYATIRNLKIMRLNKELANLLMI